MRVKENAFYILDEDKQLARQRIAELEREILELGPEFHTALTQSNETWHDNAPFDALREKQAGLAAELQTLKEVLQRAEISVPKPAKDKVSIGSRVRVMLKGKIHHFILTGHWSYRLGREIDKALVITVQSPLGQAILGKKIKETVTLPHNGQQLEIAAIE